MKVVRASILVVTALCLIVPALRTEAGSGNVQSPSLGGTWLGTLKVTPTASLRVVFNIQAKPDGSFSATLDSPDQGATAIPVSAVSAATDQVTLDVSAVSGRYEGTLSEDGSAIGGKWTQGGVSLDLALQRVNEAPKPMRPQEPKKPYPYSEEEVTYENAKAGNTRVTIKELAGLNHLFQTATTGAFDEYARIEETMAPLALETIADWVVAQTQ